MKKFLISAAVFAVTFIAVYLFLSNCIPGWKIKLSAPPDVYFIHNLQKLWHIKSAVSGIISLIAGGVTFNLFRKK